MSSSLVLTFLTGAHERHVLDPRRGKGKLKVTNAPRVVYGAETGLTVLEVSPVHANEDFENAGVDKARVVPGSVDGGHDLASISRAVERGVVVVSGTGLALEQDERAFGTGVLACSAR